jgi:hypothetical protein
MKGLNLSSSAIVDGMVTDFKLACLDFKSLLSGSTVAANSRFFFVYS